MLTRYKDIEPFITKDGSEIRELMHPQHHAVLKQSLAEATVPPGSETLLHQHQITEELYHITQGRGVMRLGVETFPVKVGDTIRIAPGTAHNIRNDGDEPLKILCSCSPAYRDDDTQLL
ncbi:MAG: cupin domain-containing protein [Gammaproteobacteria bacterium]|jgi:mannose-6-phosphate isomerase-like protein (cupin superfamily)